MKRVLSPNVRIKGVTGEHGLTCYHCKQYGYYKKNCPKLRKGELRKGQEDKRNVIRNSGKCLLTTAFGVEKFGKKDWHIDSTSSSHVSKQLLRRVYAT